ncbi:hypothetical protein JY97_14165 [Alkalispirochaeta odontotermitis]|nr:hypothetical protein JY97_14165 [Alkalispirochaeta odontotermitis]CAB1078025.1 Urea carboxylase-related aminomethyltransferase (EC [Olavius algarvensis Delta 1 endosymbiont]
MQEQIDPITQYQIAPQTGVAFAIQKDQVIRVIDVDGEQVADLVCFARRNPEEYLSSGRSIDYNEKLFLSTGDVLYSNLSQPMLTITRDPVGKHDLLFAPCSQEMFQLTYNTTEPHPNCLDNLAAVLDRHGIRSSQIPTPFNIFMNVAITAAGRVTVRPPLSKAGDFIDLRSEMDLIVALSACSAGKCNNFRCTPIKVDIYNA